MTNPAIGEKGLESGQGTSQLKPSLPEYIHELIILTSLPSVPVFPMQLVLPATGINNAGRHDSRDLSQCCTVLTHYWLMGFMHSTLM